MEYLVLSVTRRGTGRETRTEFVMIPDSNTSVEAIRIIYDRCRLILRTDNYMTAMAMKAFLTKMLVDQPGDASDNFRQQFFN